MRMPMKSNVAPTSAPASIALIATVAVGKHSRARQQQRRLATSVAPTVCSHESAWIRAADGTGVIHRHATPALGLHNLRFLARNSSPILESSVSVRRACLRYIGSSVLVGGRQARPSEAGAEQAAHEADTLLRLQTCPRVPRLLASGTFADGQDYVVVAPHGQHLSLKSDGAGVHYLDARVRGDAVRVRAGRAIAAPRHLVWQHRAH